MGAPKGKSPRGHAFTEEQSEAFRELLRKAVSRAELVTGEKLRQDDIAVILGISQSHTAMFLGRQRSASYAMALRIVRLHGYQGVEEFLARQNLLHPEELERRRTVGQSTKGVRILEYVQHLATTASEIERSIDDGAIATARDLSEAIADAVKRTKVETISVLREGSVYLPIARARQLSPSEEARACFEAELNAELRTRMPEQMLAFARQHKRSEQRSGVRPERLL